MEKVGLKMCKEKLLETVSILVNLTKIPWERQSPNIQIQRFSTFIQILKLCDKLHFIEKSPESLIFFLSALSLFNEFFVKFVLKTPDANLRLWDSNVAKEGISKNGIHLILSNQFIHPNQVYLFEKREEDEIALNMQILLRNELNRGETVATTELDIVGDVELDATVIDVDEACNIIQNAERIYQSISRYFHLVDVRQKALDLQISSTKQNDPLKAIIKIQAITRGYLTRKRVRLLRDEENARLGLNLDAFLQSTQKYLTTKFLKDLKPQQNFFAEDLLPSPPPNSVQSLEIFLKDNFFSTDPLTLRDPPTISECRKVDEMTEYYFGETFLAEAVKLQPKTSSNFFIKFDDLISATTFIKAKGGKTCHLDLRTFLYATVIIPHSLSVWKQFDIKRKSILIVGDPKSGKSVWSQAAAFKCLAPRIQISKRIFTRKFTRRKRVMEIINQFVKMDKYCYIEFDKLEMFSAKKQRRTPIKALILKLFHSLKKSNAQIIGLSRTADLIPEILGEFDYIVTLKNPNGTDRYNLLADTFSRRMNESRLLKTPKRLLELSKTTKKLNIGETIEKIDKKFAAPMPPPPMLLHLS